MQSRAFCAALCHVGSLNPPQPARRSQFALIPLAVSIDHATRKIDVKLVQKGVEAEIAALGGVAFRQRADGEMFVNFASALDLPINSANALLLDTSTNTKVS
jgi:hypothetical protein